MSQLEGIRPSGQVTCWCLWIWIVRDLQFTFELTSVNIIFHKMSVFYIFYNYQYQYQGQGSRFEYFRGPFSYWVTLLHLLDEKVDSILQASDVLGNSPGYFIFNLFNLFNWKVVSTCQWVYRVHGIIETKW